MAPQEKHPRSWLLSPSRELIQPWGMYGVDGMLVSALLHCSPLIWWVTGSC